MALHDDVRACVVRALSRYPLRDGGRWRSASVRCTIPKNTFAVVEWIVRVFIALCLGASFSCAAGESVTPTRLDASTAFPNRLADWGDLTAGESAAARWPEHVAPYEPRWPLWTNGSHKTRYRISPEPIVEGSIEDEDFPMGTIFVKHFAYKDSAGQTHAVETRMMLLRDGGWDYATYAWNQEGSDAQLVDPARGGYRRVDLPGQPAFNHTIPSTRQCRVCHEASDNRLLGYTAEQLDGPTAFDRSPEPERLVGAYLNGNCAFCHRAGATAGKTLDLGPAQFVQNTVGQPLQSSLFGPGLRVVPDAPLDSALLVALAGGDEERSWPRMPPLGVDLLDTEGAQLLRTWIESLQE